MIAMENVQPEKEKVESTEKKEKKTRKRSTKTTATKTKRRSVAKKSAAPDENSLSIDADHNMLFGKYDYSSVEVRDLSLKNYINLKPAAYPNTFRTGSKKMFSKAELNIVERLMNSLMRGGTGKRVGGHVIRTEGRLQGKKIKVMHIVMKAFDIINDKTKKNPIQVLVMALENSAPIEDTTRIRQGGTVSTLSVDMSASRRLDVALKNVALASIIGAFNKKKSISQALASELIMASGNDVNSYAIRIKNEKDRMARSAR